MIELLPTYIPVIFGMTTALTLGLFYWSLKSASSETTRRESMRIVLGLITWLLIQTVFSLKNIYNTDTNSVPPKILILGILPPVLTIVFLFVTQKGRHFIDSLSLTSIIYLNVIRIPVEIVLFWLFLNHAIPELMTFEGRNFDIIAGLSAPFIAYFGIAKGKLGRKTILVWNFICLGLLINIVVNAFLSAPSPLQTMAFDQPNIAILNFPFSWLPTFIVPIVFFGHLLSIRKLMKRTS